MRTINIFILIFYCIIFSACHTNKPLPIEKDEYPEIPYFPKLEGNNLSLKLIDSIQTKQTPKYLVSGNNLFIYDIDTVRKFWVIRNNKALAKHSWTSTNNYQEGFIDTLGNIDVGEYKFNSPNYAKKIQTSISDTELEKNLLSINKKRMFATLKFDQFDYVNSKDSTFNSFASIVVGNESVNTYKEMMPQGSYYNGIYMNYFDLNFKGQKARTKIDFSKQISPKVIKTDDDLYFVYSSFNNKTIYIYAAELKN